MKSVLALNLAINSPLVMSVLCTSEQPTAIELLDIAEKIETACGCAIYINDEGLEDAIPLEVVEQLEAGDDDFIGVSADLARELVKRGASVRDGDFTVSISESGLAALKILTGKLDESLLKEGITSAESIEIMRDTGLGEKYAELAAKFKEQDIHPLLACVALGGGFNTIVGGVLAGTASGKYSYTGAELDALLDGHIDSEEQKMPEIFFMIGGGRKGMREQWSDVMADLKSL